jgi:FtsP/CotA-like multicopper oxidase with cupredoxin domain
VNRIQRSIIAVAAAGGLAWASVASAQLATPVNTGGAAFAGFPLQNLKGPSGTNYQTNYPYPGQCIADPANQALFPTLLQCVGGSFGTVADTSERTAGGWATGVRTGPVPFKILNPVVPISVLTTGIPLTPKFIYEVLNPMDYTPDTAKFTGADYYELAVHESWGAQNIATAGTALGPTLKPPFGLFPDPTQLAGAACGAVAVGTIPNGCDVPNGMQWTGLVCQTVGGCSCPADASSTFTAKYCTSGGKVPVGNPLFTPVWGVGQVNMSGGPVTAALAANLIPVAGGPLTAAYSAPTAGWSANGYAATWPSISVRAKKGTPVVVKWINEFPNNHVLCPHPEAADWPCAIDRTFMGVKARMDPALVGTSTVPPEGVNQFGSPGQPDNSWVTHLHGGEVPPSTDGFAEKWFGNPVTAVKYANVASNYVQPPFENPSGLALKRPAGSTDTYSYPMVQEEATIWFHDHTLGKTHHNVIAGPAGFFPVKEPLKHGKVVAGLCTPAAGQTCDYTWLDPVTEPRGALNIPMYDLFLAVQDRAFNDDGSFNFSNGLGQTIPAAPVPAAGSTPITNGLNPLVHPTWVPEYFGDHSVVNGTLWPKITVEPGWYRVRLVDGSDSRCYTMGLNVVAGANGAAPAVGTVKPANNLAFWVIANDQGYLQYPVKASSLTMCPGERYEVLINFGAVGNKVLNGGAATVYVTNTAPAPFPAGITPQAAASPYADLNVLFRFDVNPAKGPGLKSCATAGAPVALSWDPAAAQATNLATAVVGAGAAAKTSYASACMPANPSLMQDTSFCDLRTGVGCPAAPAVNVTRQVYLNEKVDGVTLMPLGMQLNGVPFEYKVTETPKFGSRETWQFINLTVDSHPMHPHLVKHQIVSRQTFNVGAYKTKLCGSTTCQPGTAPGGEMQVIPDITGVGLLTGAPVLVNAGNVFVAGATVASVEGGWKDASQVPPAKVTTIIADWTPRWAGAQAGTVANPYGAPSAPGSACGTGAIPGVAGATFPACATAIPFTYEAVTSGPYVWHCHINSHEDSEMMRSSLVVP